MTFEDLLSATSLPGSASGATPSDKQVGQTTGLSGPDPAHANLSARQAKEKGLMTSGTHGPPSTGSSASVDLTESLVSRLRAELENRGSTLYRLTWKQKTTPAGRLHFRLAASVRRIKDSVCTGWPTTTGKDGNSSARHGNMIKGNPGTTLLDAARMTTWPTPDRGTACRGVPENLLATHRPSGAFLQVSLNHAAALTTWPTPATRDHKGGYQGGRIRNGKISTDTLDVAAQLAGPARLTATGQMLTGSSAETNAGGPLNPAHSRWLMALPPEWDACAVTATQLLQNKRKSSSKP
tara:strand:- start:38 stop:922 length:885 start_codon:yes stop_codon:yes gene_type:complete